MEHFDAPPQFMRENVSVKNDEFQKRFGVKRRLIKIHILTHNTTFFYSLLERIKDEHLMI